MDESFELEQQSGEDAASPLPISGSVVSKNARGSHVAYGFVNHLRALLPKHHPLRPYRKMRNNRPQGICKAKVMCRKQPINAIHTLLAPRNGYNFFESCKLVDVDWKKERAVLIFSRVLLEELGTSPRVVRDLEKLMGSLKKNLETNFEDYPLLKEDGFSIRNHPRICGKIRQLTEKYVP